MTLALYQLPVVQNWDCHVCGTCCQEYLVTVSDEERRRIAQLLHETTAQDLAALKMHLGRVTRTGAGLSTADRAAWSPLCWTALMPTRAQPSSTP